MDGAALRAARAVRRRENQADGTVLVRAAGDAVALEQLLADLRDGTAGRPGRVDDVEVADR